MSRTVVTLSRNAESTAVIRQKRTMIIQGLPLAIFAALMARYSKIPEFLTTATKIIMPARTPSVPKSMCSMPTSNETMPVRISTTAPASAAVVRCIFSEMISANTTMKITMEIICGVVNSGMCITLLTLPRARRGKPLSEGWRHAIPELKTFTRIKKEGSRLP